MPNLIFSDPPMNLTIIAENPQWLVVFYHAFGIVSFSINALAVYCILKKSPKEMQVYKWFLLNIWVSKIIICDVTNI